MESETIALANRIVTDAAQVVFKVFKTKINQGDYTIKLPIQTVIAGLNLLY